MKPFDFARFPGLAGDQLRKNASRVSLAMAAGFRPPEKISVAEWAVRHRVFPSDTAYAGRWRHETGPYLVEMMQCLSPDHPAEEVAIMKCAQSGGSATAENLVGYVADVAPGPMMYVHPTIKAATDWAEEKLWPMIHATPRLAPANRGAVIGPKKADGEGSTKTRIKFRKGGWCLLAGANSAATLRQHSIRFAIEDDLDQFPDDLDGQGSPEGMVTARLRVYARQGISKRLKISTGTIKGASKIGRAYEASDQRRYFLKCAACGDRFDPVFQDIRWPDGRPQEAYLAAPCCGAVLHHWQKGGMSTFDGWCPTVDLEGAKPPRTMSEAEFQTWRARDVGHRQPGFHLSGIISAFLTWAQLAKGFVDAQGNLNQLKSWTNLELGDLFEVKGETPEADAVASLREQDWGRGQTPFGPIVFTMGVDVQGDGLYFEKVGWGPNAESWSLDHGFIPGATDVAGEGAWEGLEAVARQTITLPSGRSFELDAICCDAGYHTDPAKAWCKRSPKRLPVFGREGWTRPILGRGEATEYTHHGRRAGQASKRPDDKAYLVGTYGAKLSFTGYLRATLEAVAAIGRGERDTLPRGACHFGRDADADYFKMVTSETCVVEVTRHVPRRVWKVKPGHQNHLLDARIYNMAAAEFLKLDGLGEADWAALIAERRAAPEGGGDLVEMAMRAGPERAPASAAGRDEANGVRVAAPGGWINAGGGWIR